MNSFQSSSLGTLAVEVPELLGEHAKSPVSTQVVIEDTRGLDLTDLTVSESTFVFTNKAYISMTPLCRNSSK